MEGVEARRQALRILWDYSEKDAYLNLVLRECLRGSSLDRRDRALVTEIVQGTVRMLLNLDWRLCSYSSRPLDAVEPRVLWVLRASAYQMCYMSVPAYAACDLASTITREEFGSGAAGYVNAVLRSMARADEGPSYPEPSIDPVGHLSLRNSHPRWLVEMWLEELGYGTARALCEADNRSLPVSVRCNLSRVSRDEAASVLEERGIEVEYSSIVPEGLLLKGGGSIAAMKEYQDGLISVQDEGAILVGHVVAPRAGMRVLDMCAAPGGKANHMAELMGNRGTVVAVDRSEARLAYVEKSAARLGNRIIRTVATDATRADTRLEGDFDRVLVDAPCSGLGTLSRRPDVRWRKSPDDVDRLTELQASLLGAGAERLERGGILVYSTCTISGRENRLMIEGFLRRRRDFEVVDLSYLTGGEEGPFIQLFPHLHGCDGFFIAAVTRK